jgi:hypothetical protein
MKRCPNYILFMVVCMLFSFNFMIYTNTLYAQSRIVEYTTEIDLGSQSLNYSSNVHILIENEEDQHYGNISLRYKGKNNLDITEASVFNKNGVLVRKLSRNEILMESDLDGQGFIVDYFTKSFRLTWNDYPYIIKYSYKETFRDYITIAEWSPYLHEKLPVESAILTFICPKTEKIRIKSDSIFDSSLNFNENKAIYKWSAQRLPALEIEPFSPGLDGLSPKVRIVPILFKYENHGSFESWESFGLWVARLLKNKITIPTEEKSIINGLINGLNNKREIINSLVNYRRQNTRYVNIVLKKSGMVPASAASTSYSKLGDCKALTVYMMALLKEAGIESYYTLVRSGDRPEPFDEYFPDMVFDHVILAVPLENDTIWIENTTSYLPSGYIGTFTQNRTGLLCSETGSNLVRIPPIKQDQHGEFTEYNLKVSKDRLAEGSMKKIAKGPGYEFYSAFFEVYNNMEKKKNLELSFYPHFAKVDSISYSIPDLTKPEIYIKSNLQLENHWIEDGKNIIFNLINYKPPLAPFIAEKNYDFSVDYPIYVKETVNYDLSGLENKTFQFPDQITVETRFGFYKLDTKYSTDKLIVTSEYALHSGNYRKVEYKEFYDFFYTIYQSF